MFSFAVAYRREGSLRRFYASTDVKWEEFRELACVCMGIGPGSDLSYRQFHDIRTDSRSVDSLGYYGSLHPLTGADEWEKAIIDLRRAGWEGLDVEIEVLHTEREEVGANTCKFLQ